MEKALKCLAVTFVLALVCTSASARTKLVALPGRDATIIRLDNPAHTLVEEERVCASSRSEPVDIR